MRSRHLALIVLLSLSVLGTAEQSPQPKPDTAQAPATSESQMSRPQPPAAAETMDVEVEQRQILGTLNMLHEAAVKNAVGFMEDVFTDDYVAINAQAEQQNKQLVLQAHRNGDIHFAMIQPRDVQIRLYSGDAAVERSTALVRGDYKGRDFSGIYGSTRTWRKENGQWKIAVFQVYSVEPLAAGVK